MLPPNAKESYPKKSNFIRRCKQFEVDEEQILYTRPTNKNGRRRVLPKYDTKLRELVLNRFTTNQTIVSITKLTQRLWKRTLELPKRKSEHTSTNVHRAPLIHRLRKKRT